MIDFKMLSDAGLAGPILGFLGGVIRYVSGVVAVSSWWREVAILFIISAPSGWLAGGLVAESGYGGYVEYTAGVGAGLMAQSIVRFMLLTGVKGLIKIYRGG